LDLRQEDARWKELGNHIIVGLDANKDVRHGDTTVMFQDMEMGELILQSHSTKSPPATCNKNQRREPIDRIFATPGIHIVAGGYAPFNEGCPSDHRYLYVDISYQDAFGYPAPSSFSTTSLQQRSQKSEAL
jgi:hypothetical protein